MMTTEMGKTLAAARGRGGQVRHRLPVLRRARRGLPGRRARRRGRGRAPREAYVSYQPLGAGAGHHAVELPALAGDAVRRAGPDGRQRRACSSTPRTCRRPPCSCRTCSPGPASPTGAFQTLLVGSGRVEAILRDRRVAAATLTGSSPAGQSVAAIAGSEIKKVVLELGGSDPFVVMPSADLAEAARVAATARCLNNGQSCIAAKRFIVHEAVSDEFERLFVEPRWRPRRSATRWTRAPTSARWPPRSSSRTSRSWSPTPWPRARGCCAAAPPPDGPGYYYPPTVLAGITPEMRVHREEVFGPVATLYRVAGHRRGHRAGQRHRVRARRQRLDRGRGGAGSASSADLDAGMVFINGNVDLLPAAAVRRDQDLRATAGSCRPTASGSSATSRRSGSASKRVRPACAAPGGAGRPVRLPMSGLAVLAAVIWSMVATSRSRIIA